MSPPSLHLLLGSSLSSVIPTVVLQEGTFTGGLRVCVCMYAHRCADVCKHTHAFVFVCTHGCTCSCVGMCLRTSCMDVCIYVCSHGNAIRQAQE